MKPITAEFHHCVTSFEQAWLRGESPQVRDFLPRQVQIDGGEQRAILGELICIDIEFRAKSSQYDPAATKHATAQHFAEFALLLDDPAIVCEILAEAFRWGLQAADEEISSFAIPGGVAHSTIENARRQFDYERIQEAGSPSAHENSSIRSFSRPTQVGQIAVTHDHRDFVIQRHIGSGSTGKVYQAQHLKTRQVVALKHLRKQLVSDPVALRRFFEEYEVVSKLDHPNIVQSFGLGQTPVSYFIAQQWINGRDLSHYVGPDRIKIDLCLSWLMQLCDALGEAHRLGVIHCDLKPANLLIDGEGKLFLTDFGFAISDGVTRLHRLEGTAGFMAPEQVSSSWGTICRRTDVYGVGAVCHSLLTGDPPWTGSQLAEVLAAVISSRPVMPPRRLNFWGAEHLVEICLRCLAKSPEDRYQSVTEVRQSLELVQNNL